MLYSILGDTRSTLNGVICWAIFNVIGKVFPFPSPFLGDLMQKPSNNYSFFVKQIHLKTVIETHVFLTKTNVY